MDGKIVKSPLRYPGGKSKLLKNLLPLFPKEISKYGEPFVGGGSVFLAIKSLDPSIDCTINDLNKDVYSFWSQLTREGERVIKQITFLMFQKSIAPMEVNSIHHDPKQFYKEIVDNIKEDSSEWERAIRFFVLNRITFSGTTECGGFSGMAYQSRFTHSCIDRLKEVKNLLCTTSHTTVLNENYTECLHFCGGEETTFSYLDPPYISNKKSKLYGKKGDLHTSFDINQFAENMKMFRNHGKWAISLDDCQEVRDLFSNFTTIVEINAQYSMDNAGGNAPKKKKELVILNYTP